MADRILIKGGYVLSQDPQVGELAGGDVWSRVTASPRWARVSPRTEPSHRCHGRHRHPGLRRHPSPHVETSIRRCAPDYALITYFSAILDQFAPRYRADDVLAANRWGALECINAGITTLVDWSHIMNTDEHAYAAVQGLRETGIRSVFAFGFPNTSLVTWWFGPDYAGSVERIDGDLARRLRANTLSDDSALVTMALATRGTNFCKPDVVRYEWELAKELGINVTVHVAMDRFGYTKGQLTALRDLDLLYPNTTYIHASHLTDDEWLLVRDSGGNVSLAPQIEIQMGHGWAPAQKADALGIPWACPRTWPRRLGPTSSPRCTSVRLRAGPSAPDNLTRDSTARADPGPGHGAPGAAMGDHRWREGGRDRRSDGIADTRQEGRHRDHRRRRGEHLPGDRPRGSRRLRRGHLERGDGHHRWRHPQARRSAGRRPRRAACRGRRVARLPGEPGPHPGRLGGAGPGVALAPPRFDGRRLRAPAIVCPGAEAWLRPAWAPGWPRPRRGR